MPKREQIEWCGRAARNRCFVQRLVRDSPLLVLDIDGTLIRCQQANRAAITRLRLFLEDWSTEARQLVYATTRSIALAMRAVIAYSLPTPGYIICDAGGSAFKWGTREPLFHLVPASGCWNPEAIDDIALQHPEIAGLIPGRSSPTKRLFRVRTNSTWEAPAGLNERLDTAQLAAHALVTSAREICVIPRTSGKERAAQTLAALLRIPLADAVAAGDSECDLGLLRTCPASILVGNASGRLQTYVRRTLPHVIIAREPAASGVVEGLNTLRSYRSRLASRLSLPLVERRADAHTLDDLLRLLRSSSPSRDRDEEVRFQNWADHYLRLLHALGPG